MAHFDITNIADIRRLQRMLGPARYWQELERNIPRAMTRVLVALRAAAPRGKTGKLGGRFEVKIKPVSQALGLINGLHLDIGAVVPYGHLVELGHRIIPRGPQRKNVRLGRARRAELRRGLKQRQQSPVGFVPGRFFVLHTVEQMMPDVVLALGRLMTASLTSMR